MEINSLDWLMMVFCFGMIRVVGGGPGSGKSYFAANFLARFGSYDKVYRTFIIKKDMLVITNLDKFCLTHLNFDHCIEKYGIEKFLTIENFEKIQQQYNTKHIVLIIDEAQRYIDDQLLKDKEVAFFFQYHRHIGLDIFLLTNDIASCAKKVVNLAEFLIMAQPRSKGIPGVFRYKYTDTKGTFLFSQSIKKSDDVFSIYQSFTTDESEKPKNVIAHWFIIGGLIVVLAVGVFKYAIGRYQDKATKKPVKSPAAATTQPIQPGVSVYTSTAPAAVTPLPAPAAPPQPVVSTPSGSPPAPPKPPQHVVPPSDPRIPGNTKSSVYPSARELSIEAARQLQVDQDDKGVAWRRYQVDSEIMIEGKTWYSLRGRLVSAKRCRGFDEDSGTVEYFGLPLKRKYEVVQARPTQVAMTAPAAPASQVLEVKADLQPVSSKAVARPEERQQSATE